MIRQSGRFDKSTTTQDLTWLSGLGKVDRRLRERKMGASLPDTRMTPQNLFVWRIVPQVTFMQLL
jgi:hypothetical protein